jgi:hypothetical protein
MPSIAFQEVLYLFDKDGERTKVTLSTFVEEQELASCKLDNGELELMISMGHPGRRRGCLDRTGALVGLRSRD